MPLDKWCWFDLLQNVLLVTGSPKWSILPAAEALYSSAQDLFWIWFPPLAVATLDLAGWGSEKMRKWFIKMRFRGICELHCALHMPLSIFHPSKQNKLTQLKGTQMWSRASEGVWPLGRGCGLGSASEGWEGPGWSDLDNCVWLLSLSFPPQYTETANLAAELWWLCSQNRCSEKQEGSIGMRAGLQKYKKRLCVRNLRSAPQKTTPLRSERCSMTTEYWMSCEVGVEERIE